MSADLQGLLFASKPLNEFEFNESASIFEALFLIEQEVLCHRIEHNSAGSCRGNNIALTV